MVAPLSFGPPPSLDPAEEYVVFVPFFKPAIRELHRRHGPVLTLRFLSQRPAIFVSGRGATHRVRAGLREPLARHRVVPRPHQQPDHHPLQ
jgi:hypothetical protein